MTMKNIITILLLFVFTSPCHAQANQDDETKSEIPELNKFHSTIYQLWHTGWPNKDVVLLKKLIPDIETGYKKISGAVLPGILRDKKPKWEAAVKDLDATIAAYKTAAGAGDTTALLNAAEKLHMQYEGLVRLVKPVLKEIDDFHQVLYMIYHYYLPEYNFPQIKTAVANLKLQMDTLNAAVLYKEMDLLSLMQTYPSMEKANAEKVIQRRTVRTEKFVEARKNLTASVLNVVEVVKANNDKDTVTKAITSMHADYESLVKIFD
jgi:hypothetical protein